MTNATTTSPITVLRLLLGLAVGGGLAACNNGPGDKPRLATPVVIATSTALGIDPEVAREEALNDGADRLSAALADAYQQARTKVAPVLGAVRYSGNMSGFLELAAALPETDIGFRSFQYKLDCDVAEPPSICAIARAFPPTALKLAAAELTALESKATELVVEGRADAVWVAPRKVEKYGGECGEADCITHAAPIKITTGMPVDSNQVLACLRALCVLSQSQLQDTGLPLRISGLVTAEGSRPASRRAEVRLFTKLPAAAHKRFWKGFLATVGH